MFHLKNTNQFPKLQRQSNKSRLTKGKDKEQDPRTNLLAPGEAHGSDHKPWSQLLTRSETVNVKFR